MGYARERKYVLVFFELIWCNAHGKRAYGCAMCMCKCICSTHIRTFYRKWNCKRIPLHGLNCYTHWGVVMIAHHKKNRLPASFTWWMCLVDAIVNEFPLNSGYVSNWISICVMHHSHIFGWHMHRTFSSRVVNTFIHTSGGSTFLISGIQYPSSTQVIAPFFHIQMYCVHFFGRRIKKCTRHAEI